MSDEVIEDLKQFISVTVSQQTQSLRDDILEHVDKKIDSSAERLEKKIEKKIDEKIDALSLYIGEALDNSNEAHGKQLKNHERRITRLEARAV